MYVEFDLFQGDPPAPWSVAAHLKATKVGGTIDISVVDYGDKRSKTPIVELVKCTGEHEESHRGATLVANLPATSTCSMLDVAQFAEAEGAAVVVIDTAADGRYPQNVDCLVVTLEEGDRAQLLARILEEGSNLKGALWASMPHGEDYPPRLADNLLANLPSREQVAASVMPATPRVEAIVKVFHRDQVSILHTYLQRNLRKNGGLIDHVSFYPLSSGAGFIKRPVMDELIKNNSDVYSSLPLRYIPNGQSSLYGRIFGACTDLSTVYIVLSDNIVYIKDGAIKKMVAEKLTGKHLFVSANVVNHPSLSYYHQQGGAFRDFDFTPQLLHGGKLMQEYKATQVGAASRREFEHGGVGKCARDSWQCAAVAHESFLQALVGRNLKLFEGIGMKDMHGTLSEGDKRYTWSKWNMEAMVFQAADFRFVDTAKQALLMLKDPHLFLTSRYPEYIARTYPDESTSCVAVGSAVVASLGLAKGAMVMGLIQATSIVSKYEIVAESVENNHRIPSSILADVQSTLDDANIDDTM
jgi:hypothetical protein